MKYLNANMINEGMSNRFIQRKKKIRFSSKSRRDQPPKRSNENPVHRSTRRSPPSVTRKRHPSPPSSSSRSRHHYPTQRHHRVSSPSVSPPPPPLSQSSSRHHRPVVSVKRPHSESESPYERRPPTHRSRPELPTDRTIGDVLKAIPSIEEQRITPKHEIGDLSLISEDESTKTHHIRVSSSFFASYFARLIFLQSNGKTTNDWSSTTTK